MNIILAAIATGLTLFADFVRAQSTSIVLYDGALGKGNIPPEQQGWLTFGGVADTRISSQGVTNLRTKRSLPGGYSNYSLNSPSLVNTSFPQLDRTTGYTIRFAVKLNEENHADSDKNGDGIGDRAGFSVIVISNDNKGIEIGFWKSDPNPQIKDRIWVQQDGAALPPRGILFTHTAEGVPFNTGTMTCYALQVKGNQYKLFAGNSPQPILTGSLRDYTTFDHKSNQPPLPYNPYTTPNFLFLGDDTSSASANFDLKYVAIDTILVVSPCN